MGDKHDFPFGGVYILHATKQVAGMNRRRRPRLSRKRLIGLVPKPAPAPTPTPRNPYPRKKSTNQKGSVAA